MDKKKSLKIWLDVSTLKEWQQTPVGSVRVEQECARAFLARPDVDVALCYFNEKMQRIYALPSAEAQNLLNKACFSHTGNKPTHLAFRIRNQLNQLFSDKVASFLYRKIYALYKILVCFYAACLKPIRFFHEQSKAAESTVSRAYPITPQPGEVFLLTGIFHYNPVFFQHLQQFRDNGVFVMTTCHDIIPLDAPQLCLNDAPAHFRNYIDSLINHSSLIACDSVYTENRLQIYAKQQKKNPVTTQVTIGSSLPPVSGSILPDEARKLKKFIMYVSSIHYRKNHEVLYKAYVYLYEKGCRDLPPILFVGSAFRDDFYLFTLIRQDKRINHLFIFLNNISDAILTELYSRCLFTVYPSLYEGWGLPVAESLAQGKFCIASNASSIPEVGKHFVDYLYPWDVIGWGERIHYYFQHPEILVEKNQAIQQRFKAVSWADTAEQWLRIIDQQQELRCLPGALYELLEFSREIGINPALIQGAGGNTSIKIDDTLWVKASGENLANALTKNIFVNLSMAELERALTQPTESPSTLKVKPNQLKPSIETLLHAAISLKYVVHTHSINALAEVLQPTVMAKTIMDAPVFQVPYFKPGFQLAKAIAQIDLTNLSAAIFLLENHGVILAANDLETIKALLIATEKTWLKPPRSYSSSTSLLQTYATQHGLVLARENMTHSLATDTASYTLGHHAPLYPDQTVFLGTQLQLFDSFDTLTDYHHNHGWPAYAIIKDHGVLFNPANKLQTQIEVQLAGHAELLLKLDPLLTCQGLSPEQINELVNWDAEEYRRNRAVKACL